MSELVMAVIALGLVLVGIWGVFEGERDRDQRHRDRQLMKELQRQEVHDG